MGIDNGSQLLLKIDENTDQVVFSTAITHGDIDKILLMPNGNIAGKVRAGTDAGDLFEFDSTTGAEIGRIHDIDNGDGYNDHYKFSVNGDLEVYDHSQHKMIVYSQNSGYITSIKETNLYDPTENLFRSNVTDWEFVNGEFHGIVSSYFMNLSDNLVHGNLTANVLQSVPHIDIQKMWFNNNGTYTVVAKNTVDNKIHLIKVENIPLDTSLIQTVHIGGIVVDGRNGQEYNNSQWETVDPHILTLVIDDASIPIIGSTPPSTWLNLPNGYTYGGAFPVRDDNGVLTYDALCYNTSTMNKTWVRVRIIASSSVGVQDNSLSDFKVWPNPATDYIKVSAKDKISKIEIYDISGRLLIKQDYVKGENVLVNHLSKGQYLVKAITTDGKVGINNIMVR